MDDLVLQGETTMLFLNDVVANRSIDIAEIKTGDLLGWKSNKENKLSDLFIGIVRAVTHSSYGHVGIAYRYGPNAEDVLCYEATIPSIGFCQLPLATDVDVVPMGLKAVVDNGWYFRMLGIPYGYLDAVRAGLGMKPKADNQFQCAEFCDYYYRANAISLTHDYTPGGLMKAAIAYRQTKTPAS